MLNLHTFAGYTWDVDRKRLQYSRLTNGNRIELCFSNLHRSRNPKYLPNAFLVYARNIIYDYDLDNI